MRLPGRTDSDRQDIAFLILRGLAFAGGLLFVLSSRSAFPSIRTVLALFGLFATVSLALYLAAWPFLKNKKHFYLLAGWVDLPILAALIHLTGGFRSDFMPALYLFCAFHSYYFGKREGAPFALGVASVLLFFLIEARSLPGGPAWSDAILPIGVIGTLSVLMGQLSDHDRALFRQVQSQREESVARWQTSEETIEQLLEMLPDMAGCGDANRRILRVNRKMLEASGYTLEEVMGKDFTELVAPEAVKSNVDGFERTRTQGSSVHETVMVTKDGRRIPCEVSGIAIRDREGRFVSTLGVARDISARKEAEKQGRAMTERLSAVGLLASGVAHEINNPLAGLMNALRALEQDEMEPERRNRYMTIMRDGLERMAETVRGLLDFSRPGSLRPSRVNLPNVIDDCIDLLSPAIKEKSLNVRRLWDSPPAVKAGTAVTADSGQLRQACVNVFLNSIQAAPPHGVIEVSLLKHAHFIGVQIADNGPGIPPEIRERICEPFYTTKPQGEGTGLGLSVTLGIVKAHGGHLEFRDRLGGGASVTMWLPADGERVQGAEVTET